MNKNKYLCKKNNTIMKTLIFSSIFAIASFLLISCSDDDSNTNQVNDVTNSVQTGSWKITYFNDSGDDETYHFTAYSFTFQSGGTVTAVSSSNTVNGTWSITSSSSSSSSGNKFNLNMGSNDPFEELNDDWDIQENSNTKIKLMDVSGGNGGIDYLTFEKN